MIKDQSTDRPTGDFFIWSVSSPHTKNESKFCRRFEESHHTFRKLVALGKRFPNSTDLMKRFVVFFIFVTLTCCSPKTTPEFCKPDEKVRRFFSFLVPEFAALGKRLPKNRIILHSYVVVHLPLASYWPREKRKHQFLLVTVLVGLAFPTLSRKNRKNIDNFSSIQQVQPFYSCGFVSLLRYDQHFGPPPSREITRSHRMALQRGLQYFSGNYEDHKSDTC